MRRVVAVLIEALGDSPAVALALAIAATILMFIPAGGAILARIL